MKRERQRKASGIAERDMTEDEHIEGETLLNKQSETKPSEIKTAKKKNFLVIYGLTLMAIAFVLVLMSYLNEIRANRAQIANLKEEKEQYSISAMQDIQSLEDENKSLREQVESLSDENKAYKQQVQELEQLKADLEGQNTKQEKTAVQLTAERDKANAQQAAIEAMMNISELYANRKYSHSAYEISLIESGNSEYITGLFADQKNGPMIEKLIDRYLDVRAWLEKRGYMAPERIEKWKNQNITKESDGN